MNGSALGRKAAQAAFLALIGAAGGLVIGFVAFAFGGLIGRSGYTGQEYVGYWAPQEYWWMAKTFAAPVGAVMAPVTYLGFLQHVPLKAAVVSGAIGTLLGGLIGALGSPLHAGLAACSGFLLACMLVSDKYR